VKIIESIEEFKTFSDSFDRHAWVLVPVFSDHVEHPAANTLCLLGAYSLVEKELVVLPFDHPEANNLPIACLAGLRQFIAETPDANILRYVVSENQMKMKDVQALEFASTGKMTEQIYFYPSIIKQMHERHYHNRNVNRSIPLYKWTEFFRDYAKHVEKVLNDYDGPIVNGQYRFLQNIAIPALHFIEKSGLHVEPKLLREKFGKKIDRHIHGDLVYSQYNLFTSTVRPSCRFGGINFAALNKDDGTRTAFTSRFDGGSLILIDFESYHLRLIADLIGYKLPSIPTHEYFGRQYFKTDKLTQEQYDESKVKSFQLLYSDTESNIPFFKRVRQYKHQLWKNIQERGLILSPHHKIEIHLNRIWDPNPAKVFNYLIQLVETERNLSLLKQLSQHWDFLESKVILYNYDAILIDAHPTDGTEFIKSTIHLLSDNGKFPVRIKQGKNYNAMEQI